MTVSTTLIALLPVMFGTETGSQVMKRIAAPMVGGLVSSTLMTLLILPAVYSGWKRWSLRKTLSPDPGGGEPVDNRPFKKQKGPDGPLT